MILEKYTKKIIRDTWHGCYDESWKDLIVPEAFAHPAKMAYGLTNRIFRHILSEGWVKPADVVVDPFGGIGSTGIVGAHFGLQVVCVELEQKFVELAKQNFELHRKSIETFTHFGKVVFPVIIQGDSRQLYGLLRVAHILSEKVASCCDVVVGSPPFTERQPSPDARPLDGRKNERCELREHQKDSYGQTPGQLGAMKPGSIDAVVSSPPYAETNKEIKNADSLVEKLYQSKQSGELKTNMGGDFRKALKKEFQKSYGSTPGNLGNLKPGEVDSIVNNQSSIVNGKVDAVVSSPPYEGSAESGSRHGDSGIVGRDKKCGGSQKTNFRYSENHESENLGGYKGQTFWQAAKQIVQQCHQILKPGGHAVWVVKSFVRNKKIVDFPGDWRKLCESVGFETLHEHHAMLVKETRKQSLFGHEILEKKERKSFFRRLAEQKGSPKIDYEVVLCMGRRTANIE